MECARVLFPLLMKFLRALQFLIVLALIMSATSCALPVSYKITQDGRNVTKHYACTVKVSKFEDKAPKETDATFKVGSEKWRTNYIKAYRDSEYASGISSMVAEDLASTGLFSQVLKPETQEKGDYELRATIWDFSAIGKCRTGAENVMILGSTLFSVPGALIAAASTAWVKTDIVTSVILTDIELVNTRTGKRVWTCPPLKAGGQQRKHWSKADVPPLIAAANNDLRDVVTQLINRLNSDAPKL